MLIVHIKNLRNRLFTTYKRKNFNIMGILTDTNPIWLNSYLCELIFTQNRFFHSAINVIGKNSIPTHQSVLQSLYSGIYLRKLHFLSFFTAPNLLCILFRHTPGVPMLLSLSVGRQHVITTGRKKVEMVVVTLSADMVFLAFSSLIQAFIKWLPVDILCTVLSKVPKYPVFSKIKKFYLRQAFY